MDESNNPREARTISLPAKVTVSLRAGAVLAVANVICVFLICGAYTRGHTEPKVINVTGSAKKQITSDLIVWQAGVSATRPQLVDAYTELASGMDKTLAYLKSHGINEKQIAVSAVTTTEHHAKDAKGRETDQISEYELSQYAEVTSEDIDHVTDVSRSVTALIKEGVLLESHPAKYIYTKLADLKITMLAEATRDATMRAQQIADNSGGKLGAIQEAHMGVMQINALHDDDVSGSGVNDTTSPQKEIMAVVTATFGLQ